MTSYKSAKTEDDVSGRWHSSYHHACPHITAYERGFSHPVNKDMNRIFSISQWFSLRVSHSLQQYYSVTAATLSDWGEETAWQIWKGKVLTYSLRLEIHLLMLLFWMSLRKSLCTCRSVLLVKMWNSRTEAKLVTETIIYQYCINLMRNLLLNSW